MSNNIEGKVVVITGASSGLGEATARLLSAQGASVVLGARRADRLQALADELTGSGGKAIAVTTDVTHRDQVKKLVDAAVQTCGRIDVMINNAGLMPQSPLDRLKIDEWDRMIDVNIKGVLYGIAAALPLHAAAESRTHHQRLLGSRPQGRARRRGLCGDQARRARPLRRTAPGSEALQHPHDGDLAGRGRHGTAEQRDRSGRRRENPQILCGGRHPRRLVRARGRLRHEPARRRGHQRDRVPADPAGNRKDPNRSRQLQRPSPVPQASNDLHASPLGDRTERLTWVILDRDCQRRRLYLSALLRKRPSASKRNLSLRANSDSRTAAKSISIRSPGRRGRAVTAGS